MGITCPPYRTDGESFGAPAWGESLPLRYHSCIRHASGLYLRLVPSVTLPYTCNALFLTAKAHARRTRTSWTDRRKKMPVMEKNTFADMHRLTMQLGDHIKKDITVPCYQRGYIWGKEHGKNKQNSVSSMLDSLLNGYKAQRDIFIQGMTVIASEKNLEIIDGQQHNILLSPSEDHG